MAHDYTFGIEEEYFLADEQTGHSPSREPAERFHEAAGEAVEVAEHELLMGQVEVSTEPGTTFDEARNALGACRRDLARLAAEQGLLLFAAGSHPLAFVEDQTVATVDRYKRLGDELKLIAPKAAVCAMHVHVEVPDAGVRIGLINRLTPFLPLLFALSVASPFWEGRDSGLQGYRLRAFAQWPRAGLPECFADQAQYEMYIARLRTAGFIEDASFVWTYIRPSVHYPTIEMRICDSCTNLDDGIAIAALYRALVRAVVRRADINADFGPVERGLCGINLWRAQQAGVKATFASTASDRTLGVEEMLEETLALVAEDLEALGLGGWPQRLRAIVREGSSADRQLRRYRDAQGSESERALQVIKGLAAETRTTS